MSRLCGTRQILLILFSVMILLMSATPGSALEIEIGNWSSPAFPNAGPAVANVTVSYGCGELLSAGGDIEVSATLQEGMGGSVSIPTEGFTPATPVADCTPGEDVTESFDMTYTATTGQTEGSTAAITVAALYDEGGPLEANDTKTATATVGPYLDVTFTALNTTFDGVIGGDNVTVQIEMSSQSNGETMAMTSLEVPEGWDAPRITSPSVPSPLTGDDGVGTLSFDIQVPEDATGEYTLNLTAWATTVGNMKLESDPESIPIVLDVTSLAEVEAENEESPAPVAVVLLVTLVAALVAVRRRR